MNDPYSSAYTADEIENLPSTTTVFSEEALDFHKHQWHQEGYELVTSINGNRIGIPIPNGKMLIKGDNGYELIDEARPELDPKRADSKLQKSEAARVEKEHKAKKKK